MSISVVHRNKPLYHVTRRMMSLMENISLLEPDLVDLQIIALNQGYVYNCSNAYIVYCFSTYGRISYVYIYLTSHIIISNEVSLVSNGVDWPLLHSCLKLFDERALDCAPALQWLFVSLQVCVTVLWLFLEIIIIFSVESYIS